MPTKVITGVTSTGSIGTLSANADESLLSVFATTGLTAVAVSIINGPVSGARTALVAAELRMVYMNRKPTSRDRVVYANED
jgi:hypothetical protein